ncbi:MAG: ABC transporter ATP-binding protein [Flavobacteriales bacterium]|nr:ABC transporter ATP-binding protein [Flavobacteriales bacterium]
MKTEDLLHIRRLNASFINQGREDHVLHDLNITLRKGQTLGIVGESGSGKSVTSLSIMRLIPSPPINYPSGQILFEEEEIDLLTTSEEKIRGLRGNRIAMIFQEPMTSLNPLKRCGKQVLEAILVHSSLDNSAARSQVIDLFQKVKLPDPERAYSSYPHELSGGQKQRVMIAMAISCSPDLLIADEPTTALDVTVQKEILELLQEIQENTGMSMIFISHDLGVVSKISDELVVMHQGRIVEQGRSQDILDDPQDDYTKGLLNSRPPLRGRPERLTTVSDYLEDTVREKEVDEETRIKRLGLIYSQQPLIRISDLHTWYPIKKGILRKSVDHVKAVNGVTLDLFPRETLGVVGESGCGKSTLGRTIIGLEVPHSGSITYKGKALSEMNSKERKTFTREVQMIFQDPYSSLNPRMSIGEAIKEPMEVYSLHPSSSHRKEKTLELLEKVGLERNHYDRYPHEFSGGQRQRICIARTLALEPEVIICDESVSALDVSVQAQVLNLLNDLKGEFGLSYLFISHDLAVVRYMSDKVVVMNQGQIMEYEEADTLYSNPQHPYTEKLISSIYTLDSDVSRS